jgi:hypothetical protein
MSAIEKSLPARFGAWPRTLGGYAPATPSERTSNLSQRKKTEEAWRRSFAPAFRLILRLENALFPMTLGAMAAASQESPLLGEAKHRE